MAEFFKASNTETNKNNDDDISIWDKLRKGSPILSEVYIKYLYIIIRLFNIKHKI